MDKRYQVFISSTYADLKDERQKIFQSLMEMDCIPSGMELFPALDEDQFNFIKKIIDDCDYYILVIGGRYGSLNADGISYTELEFDYAISKKIPVIALLHGSPEEIIVAKTDKDAISAAKLNEFRKKVESGRLVKYWKDANEIPGFVYSSLSRTIKTYPAVGWIRSNELVSPSKDSIDLINKFNFLQKENEKLKDSLKSLSSENKVSNLADMEENFPVIVTHVNPGFSTKSERVLGVSWSEIFYIISPYVMAGNREDYLNNQLAIGVLKFNKIPFGNAFTPKISDDDFFTIKIQLRAYGFISINSLHQNWSLTKKGDEMIDELRTVRRSLNEMPEELD